jgi:excisionase family DNA binding protein
MSRHLRDELLTVAQVADYCLVSERTVRRWIKAGELPALRLGRQLRIRELDLARFFDRRAE